VMSMTVEECCNGGDGGAKGCFDVIRHVDGIWLAAGVCVEILQTQNQFDINSWWEGCLRVIWERDMEYRQSRPQQQLLPPLLLYRLVWLVGCVTHILSPDANLPHAIQLVVKTTLLFSRSSNAVIVSLAGVRTLTSMLEATEHYSILKPLVLPLLGACQALCASLCESDSQQVILEFVTLMVSFCGLQNGEEVEMVLSLLPPLWQAKRELRTFIFDVLASVLVSCSSQCDNSSSIDNHSGVNAMANVCCPLIDSVLAEESGGGGFLVGEALVLWCRIVRVGGWNGQGVVKFERLGRMLMDDLEHLRITTLLCESYIWLTPTLNNDGDGSTNPIPSTLTQVLHQTIGKVRTRGASYVHLITEALLIKFPREGTHLLCQSGITAKLLQSLFLKDEEDVILCYYLTNVGRMLLHNATALDAFYPFRIVVGETTTVFEGRDLVRHR